MTWFILQQGPQLFWEQWWRSPSSKPSRQLEHVQKRALEVFFDNPDLDVHKFAHCLEAEWMDVDEKCHEEQQRFAETVQQAIHERSGGDCQIKHFPFFRGYTRHVGDRAWKSDLEDVPFCINFRTGRDRRFVPRREKEIQDTAEGAASLAGKGRCGPAQ